jgi:hypothetical protein
MRESGTTRSFVLRANVVPDVDGGSGCGAIKDGDEAQTVR